MNTISRKLTPELRTISILVKDLITHLLCVDPVKRYTIDQFLAHPWVRAGEQSMYANDSEALSGAVPEISIASSVPQPAFAENKRLANVAAMTPDYGTPRTPYKRRAENPLSPGVGLREVFDISNAVHRVEEETRRRHAAVTQGDARLRQAFMSHLNEEEEEQDGHMSDGSSSSAMSEEDSMTAQMGNVRLNNIAKAQDRSNLFRQQQEYQRAQEEMAAQKHQAYLRQQQLAGLAIPEHHMVSSSSHPTGHMSSSTSASTVGSTSSSNASSSRRRRAGFELNMNQATLLNRRAKHQVPASEARTVEYQEQLMRRQPPAMAV